jgi:hypothetical protein
MKKILKKHRLMGKRDVVPMTRHIPFLRISAFASQVSDFIEKENGHFDTCRVCRLTLIDVLSNQTRPVVTSTTKVA